jgi:hypothetical protein
MRQILATLAVLVAAGSLAAQTAAGDQEWALRGEGQQNGHARAAHVDAAIAGYRNAVAQNANDLEARWKLLRAIRFKGAYVAVSNDDKKKVYTDAKKAGDETLAVIDRRLREKGVNSVSKASEKQIADAAHSVPGAAEVFLWDSVNWGEWALAYGKMAAVREGAADRIKREATIAMLLNPKLEGGAPPRVLGRLHDQTPHVPFITGWASSREAVRLLNESLKIDPSNKITRVFLAEAMVNNNSDTKPQAIQMLREIITAPNDHAYETEEAAATEDAKRLLKRWS